MGILKKSSLPMAWSVSTISDITLVNPTVEKSIISDDMEVSFVPMTAVQAESGMVDISRIRKLSEVKKGYTPFCEEDILFAKITPCMENGKMAIVPALKNDIGFGSTEFHVLRPLSYVNTKFVYFFVSSKIFRTEAERFMSGAVGQRRVTTPYLSLSEIPLPPLPEQHCIVEKIEELFSELDNGIESLKKAREQLKTYRQAVLKHAFEGKLTREWREQQIQAGSPPEPAEKLLARIKKERKTQYKKQLEAWQKACEQAKRDGSKKPAKPKKPKDLPPPTEKEQAMLPELPEGWVWVRLGNVVSELFDGPFGSNLKTKDYVEEGKRVIRLENIGVMEFLNDKKSYISEKKYHVLKKHHVSYGDIIFSSFISEKTRIVVLPYYIKDAINKADCFCIRVCNINLNNVYLAHFLTTKSAHSQLIYHIHGATRPRINTTQLKNCCIPLCSNHLQHAIVSEIETRLSVCDQLEQTIEDSLKKSEALRQSILKKAFEGELTREWRETHPELISGENSAESLLVRIRAEKDRLVGDGKKRRSGKAGKK